MKEKSRQKRVALVIEDSEVLRFLFKSRLEAQFEVLSASTAEEGLRLISSTFAIDLLITDFDLSGKLDGLDMIRAMRRKNSAAPIVLCTANNFLAVRIQEALSSPSTILLSKPVEPAAFDLAIQTLLKVKRR